MKLIDSIARCMEIVANGHEDEETGEAEPVAEVVITWTIPKHGDFEIVIRRPQSSRESGVTK